MPWWDCERAVINVVLDPILIFVCDMGISGAALATVVSQICSFILCYIWGAEEEIYVYVTETLRLHWLSSRKLLGWNSVTHPAGTGKRGNHFAERGGRCIW